MVHLHCPRGILVMLMAVVHTVGGEISFFLEPFLLLNVCHFSGEIRKVRCNLDTLTPCTNGTLLSELAE